jgi:hypothetical protein
MGMKTWDHLKHYKKLYNLHPFDGLQLLALVLNNCEQGVLEEKVYRAVGGEEQDVADVFYVFLKGLTNATTNWREITKCVQKPQELFVEFEESSRAEVVGHRRYTQFLQKWGNRSSADAIPT